MNKKSEGMNKFEETRILSARALELARGAKAKVEIEKVGTLLNKDYVDIAKKELDSGVMDLEIYEQVKNS